MLARAECDGRAVGARDLRDQHGVQHPAGEFTLSGQRVRYERGAEKLALFEPLPANVKAPLRFTVGDSTTTCESWTPEQSANARLADAKP